MPRTEEDRLKGHKVKEKRWKAVEGAKQKWDCSKVEEECEEGDVMDCLGDDEMNRQWEEVNEEEEEKMLTGGWGAKGARASVWYLNFSVKEQEWETEKKNSKVIGWSTEKMMKKASKHASDPRRKFAKIIFKTKNKKKYKPEK